jgi:hypothetical protein
MRRGRPKKDRTFTEDPKAYAAAATILADADDKLDDAKIENTGAWKDATEDYKIDPAILKREMKLARRLNSSDIEVRDKARDYLRQEELCREGLGTNAQMDLLDQLVDRETQVERQAEASKIRKQSLADGDLAGKLSAAA